MIEDCLLVEAAVIDSDPYQEGNHGKMRRDSLVEVEVVMIGLDSYQEGNH
jgi:hypothetical protein